VEQLKEDLQTIKEQLFALTKNRNEALNVTNELENRYTCLLNKSLHQEKEIQALKCQNAKLLAKCQCQKSLEGTEIDEVETTKLCLDQYESKLNELYKEFLNTSKVMEQSREKVCRCIKDKHSEFEKIAASKKVLSKMIEDNDAKYTNLLKNYQQLKETERKQKEENEMLSRKVEDLESQLQETSMELEMSREVGWF
jgi:chromosome segregation ATPase